MKTATQIKDKIKNLAKEKQIDPLILSKNYMMERFLERIAWEEVCQSVEKVMVIGSSRGSKYQLSQD